MYQLYWHNPRNGGKLIKERPPSEVPFLVKFEEVNGSVTVTCNGKPIEDLETFAKHDGFDNIVNMLMWFYNEYKDEMYEMTFMAIRWLP